MPEIEEKSSRAVLISWLIVAGLVALMLLRGLASYFLIGDRPTNWNYLTLPSIPAEKYSSTTPAPQSPQTPRQMELPPTPVEKQAK